MNILFVVVGLVQLGIAIYGTVQVRKFFNWYALLVLIVVYGLAYDNLVVAAGGALGEGTLLKALNTPRFWVHALSTPAMMISAFGALRKTGSKFAQSKSLAHHHLHAGNCLTWCSWSYIDILNLDLGLQP